MYSNIVNTKISNKNIYFLFKIIIISELEIVAAANAEKNLVD